VANRYDILQNIDWLKEHATAKRTKHKGATTTVNYCINNIWRQGRRNAKMYKVFVDNFLPCVIKKSVFKHQVAVATNDRTLCTVSDEAFALLLLENSFDCWQDISIDCGMGRLHQSEDKNVGSLSRTSQLGTPRAESYMIKR
jgi:hypothetical protein